MKKRPRESEFYDSAFGLPDFRLPDAPRDKQDSSTNLDDRSVAVAVDTQDLRAQVIDALRPTNLAIGGADTLADAAVVIAELRAATQLAPLRQRMRPDAALLTVVVSNANHDSLVRAAHEAGAYACLRTPLVAEELRGHVTVALDAQLAQNQMADLARRLDLDAHLASIGRMSANLAHEISTPLQVALMNARFIHNDWPRIHDLMSTVATSNSPLAARARVELDEATSIAPAIEETLRALDKLAAVLTMMRGLMARERTLTMVRVDLCQEVKDVRNLLAVELEGVDVEAIFEPVHVLADRTLLGQIVHNLTANAAHAAKSLAAPRVRLHVYKAGTFGVVSVRDNGPGIAPAMQDRIFEPFYTTRRGEGGTGLGLALCREYALQLGATLSLWSMPGRGACFRLSVPTG
jgi:two-component system sensor histidine kinase HupT/HoxJ